MINVQSRIVRRGFLESLALLALVAIVPAVASAQSLTSAVVHPATVVNGTPSVGTVTLSAAAPAGGASVLLSSSSPAAVTLPAVIVPQGATSAQFVVDTVAVAVSTAVRIDATYNGVTFSPTLNVTPRVPVRGVSGDPWADVVIGQPDFTQTTMHEVTPTRLFSPGGILVDRSVHPNRVYLYDGGNNRVLGLSHLGSCAGGTNLGHDCTADSDCPASTCTIQEGLGADRVLGQPSLTSSACNGDSGYQRYPARAPASASSLCATPEIQGNMEERAGWANLALDSAGNLYVPDFDNHRVLRFNSPFTTDAVADHVWGQANFTDNNCNRGRTGPAPEGGPPLGDAESLCLRSILNKGFTAGVDIDSSGNLWVTDNANHRVLRFSKDPVTGIPRPVADLVLGQPDFTTSHGGADLNQMCAPAAVRVDGDGTVYVADSQLFCGLGSNGRVLVFSPPLTSGMSASGTLGSGLRSPSGLTLDPDGGIWVTDTENSQFLLFNGGSVQKVLGKACPDYSGSGDGNPYEDGPLLCYDDNRCVEGSFFFQAKGSIGIDSDGNIFLAANVVHDMWRLPAPIPSLSTTCPSPPANPVAHSADKRIFRPSQYGIGNHVGSHGFRQANGLAVTTDQLIVAEQGRLLFWNGPSTLTSGKAADGYVEQGLFTGFEFEGTEIYGRITVDRAPSPHLWAIGQPNSANDAGVEIFDLPLQTGATPIPGTTLTSPLNVKGGGTIQWDVLLMIGGIAVAPDGGKLWLADPVRHRVFRVSDPLTSPIVDIVLGQAGLDPVSDTQCNRGSSLPSRNSLCRPGAVTLDPLGNVYVSDGSLESDGNLRLLEFDASLFPANPTVALFGTPASRVFGRSGNFTATVGGCLFSSVYNKFIACSQTQPAFTADGQMVVGTLGDLSFPVIYKTPLLRDEVDGYLNDYTAYGGYSAVFDSNDDLYMLDLDHANLFIYRHPLPALPAPDLIVSALTAPATGGAGFAISVTSTTKNQTGGSAAPASTTKFYLSTDTTWDAGDTFLGSRAIPTLAPGAVSAGPTSLTIPAGTTAGPYSIIARADADNLILETIETNNTASAAIAIGPDLIISTLTIPTSAVAGSPISVTDTTKNQTGTSPAPVSTTWFYLSTNSTWEAGDTAIGSRAIPVLTAGASNSGPANVTIPAGTVTGNYYIIAKADGGGALFELNENNNTRYASIRISPPDLVVSALTVPTTGGAGTNIAASNTTKNQTNTGPAPASTTRFYLSPNTTIDATDPEIGHQAIGILAPGAAEAHSTTLAIPADTLPGTYYVIAKADADGLFTETLDTNNTASDTIVIGPDLIVSALTVPATGGAGLPIAVTSTTKNQGGGSAAASTTKFYLSTNNTYGSGDVFLGERAIGSLNPAATSAGATTLTIPTETAAGSYYILALADDPNVNHETIETNNTTAALIKISPDLIVSVLGAPTSAAAGVPFTVTDTTRNQGQGIAGASTTKFYLSANTTWDAGDLEIGSRAVGQLAYGATSVGSTSVTIPTSGTWYILAKADATGAVTEGSETNNVTSKAITITP